MRIVLTVEIENETAAIRTRGYDPIMVANRALAFLGDQVAMSGFTVLRDLFDEGHPAHVRLEVTE